MAQAKKRHYGTRQNVVEQRVLERIACGEPLDAVLGAMCESVQELLQGGARCAVHLPDRECVRLVKVIAPGLEEFFRQREPVVISPTAGSSAAAAYLRRQINTDQLDEQSPDGDAELRNVLGTQGVGSVCATPVVSMSGEVLAVFTIYVLHPVLPKERLSGVIEWATRIARIALAHESTIARLVQSEEKYRSFLEKLSDGVIVMQEGRVVYANPSANVLMGGMETDLLSSDFYAMIEPEDAVRLRAYALRRGRGERVPQEYVLNMKQRNGQMRIIRFNESLISWNGGPASLATLTDITDRERARIEVQRLNAELEQRVAERTNELAVANRDLEAFSYTVSHDLRAPVRAINGFTSILIKKHAASLDAEARRHLEFVLGAGQRMDEMIEGLLELARISRIEPRLETVDMSELARSILEQLRMAHPDRVVDCRIAENITAQGDRRLLRAVLDNLLGNAWKFTGKVSHQAHVAVGVDVRDGEQVYFVKDNGAGFDMQYAQKLFNVFSRLHRQDEFEGTGVGLATVQRIISCHGGRIWAEGKPGFGATFFFTLAAPQVKDSMINLPESSVSTSRRNLTMELARTA